MKRYDVHGVVIDVEAPAGVEAVIDSRLLAFRSAGAGSPNVTMRYRYAPARSSDGSRNAPVGGRAIYDRAGAEVLWFDDSGTLLLDDPCLRVVCEPQAGSVAVDLLADDPNTLWLATHGGLSLPLIEVLRHRGLFNVHAGAVANAERVLLLPGASGSGKSTLALALAHAGLTLLGDDTVFLQPDGDTVRVRAFSDEIDVLEGSRALLPWLAPHLAPEPRAGWPKWSLRPELVLPATVTLPTDPAVLVFPRVAGTVGSRLRAIDPGEALLDLTPNVLMTSASVAQAHLDALGVLARTVPAYRLDTGTDLAEAVGLVTDLLAS